MSMIFAHAAAQWRACRADWDLHIDSQIDVAENACNGHLVTAAGQTAGMSAADLFTGPAHRATRYATDELHDWWAAGGGRPTFANFERTWLQARQAA